MYIVKYSKGEYEYYKEHCIFVTSNKSKATRYVTKFNRIHKKYKEYYSRFEEKKLGTMSWIKDGYLEYFDRWIAVREINKCYIEEIEVR
jgi:hypothetical protein